MIELTTVLMLTFSAFYGSPAVATKDNDYPKVNRVESEIVQPMTLEDHIKDYFKDTPVLAEIARCESTYRHFKSNGKVLRGDYNPLDVGVMQINEGYHEARADKLGFDLHTLEDNLSYAKWLYQKEGTTPWNASKKCWSNANKHIAFKR